MNKLIKTQLNEMTIELEQATELLIEFANKLKNGSLLDSDRDNAKQLKMSLSNKYNLMRNAQLSLDNKLSDDETEAMANDLFQAYQTATSMYVACELIG